MDRRQNIFSLILITAMLWNVFYVPLTYAYYFIDQSDFIAQFCANIDQPELECNGKCHLKKVSEKDATNDKAPSKMMVTKNIVLYVHENAVLDFGVTVFKKLPIKRYQDLYTYLSEHSVFHPPQQDLS